MAAYCAKRLNVSKTTRKIVDLSGVIIPLTTPFEKNEKQTVNYEMLRSNIRKYEQIPLKGYCIGGTYGEGPYLKPEEKLSIIRTVKSEIATNKILIAGTTCETTTATCELSAAAAEAGADAVMVFTPFYYRAKMQDEDIIEHFNKVADSSPIPVIIYNNPGTTGIDLSLSIIEKLVVHPNICAVKEDNIMKIGCIIQSTQDSSLTVLVSSASSLLPALQIGCKGTMNGSALILGAEQCKLFSLVENNKWDEAADIQKRMIPVDYLLTKELGPSGLKAAMDVMGYYGGDCRRPLHGVNEDSKQKIRETLGNQGFL